MKNLKTFFLLSFILALTSCGALKDGFVNQKKNNSDEFLVQKKSPLVMPPEYNQLPLPKVNTNKAADEESDSIKTLILNKEDNIENSSKNTQVNTNFEEKLLEKIKSN